MQWQRINFEVIGTKWDIYVPAKLKSVALLQQQILQLTEDFDQAFSRFRPDSLVTEMSHRAGRYLLPPGGHQLLTFYRQLYDATDGLVTPLIGQVMHDSGYDAVYSLQPKTLRQPPLWDEVLELHDDTLTLRRPALLDFGAAGKGLLVDLVSEFLEVQDVHDYLVNAGGDIRYRSSEEQAVSIGLEDPQDPEQALGVASLLNSSLCGSAGNRRAWQGFHHIIDPEKLESPRHIAAVWTTADTTMMADGLSTCLYFRSPEALAEYFSFAYAVVYANGRGECSQNYPGHLFSAS